VFRAADPVVHVDLLRAAGSGTTSRAPVTPLGADRGGVGGRSSQRTQYASGVAQAVAHVDWPPSVSPEMIARIVEVLHPEQVWLFGSRARGEARADSDWDFMAILADDAPEQDLDLASVWQRLRDLRLRRVEVFTITRSEFEEWKRLLGTLAEIVASTGVVIYGGQAYRT
jgi:predicted nucleotidyltransferase